MHTLTCNTKAYSLICMICSCLFLSTAQADDFKKTVDFEKHVRAKRNAINTIAMEVKSEFGHYKVFWTKDGKYRFDLHDIKNGKSTRYVTGHNFPFQNAYVSAFDDDRTMTTVREKAKGRGRSVNDPRFIGFSNVSIKFELGDDNTLYDEGIPDRKSEAIEHITEGHHDLYKVKFVNSRGFEIESVYCKQFDYQPVARKSKNADGYLTTVEIEYQAVSDDVYFPSLIKIKTTSANGSVVHEENVTVSNVKIDQDISSSFTIEAIHLPDGKHVNYIMSDGSRKEFEVVNGSLKDRIDDLQTASVKSKEIIPNAQPVESDNSDRMYYLIAAGILLAGAIGITILLLRRKANPT